MDVRGSCRFESAESDMNSIRSPQLWKHGWSYVTLAPSAIEVQLLLRITVHYGQSVVRTERKSLSTALELRRGRFGGKLLLAATIGDGWSESAEVPLTCKCFWRLCGGSRLSSAWCSGTDSADSATQGGLAHVSSVVSLLHNSNTSAPAPHARL